MRLQRDNKEVLDTAHKVREEDAAARQAMQAQFSTAISVSAARATGCASARQGRGWWCPLAARLCGACGAPCAPIGAGRVAVRTRSLHTCV